MERTAIECEVVSGHPDLLGFHTLGGWKNRPCNVSSAEYSQLSMVSPGGFFPEADVRWGLMKLIGHH